jgi:hypothetical protein
MHIELLLSNRTYIMRISWDTFIFPDVSLSLIFSPSIVASLYYVFPLIHQYKLYINEFYNCLRHEALPIDEF